MSQKYFNEAGSPRFAPAPTRRRRGEGEAGKIPILILLAAVGLIAFLLISITAPFKDKLFSSLYPKTPSRATERVIHPPTISITSPLNGTVITSNVSFTISADSSNNAARVEFYTDDSLKCVIAAAPYTCKTKVGGNPGEIHTITAKAFNASNNQTSASVTITSK